MSRILNRKRLKNQNKIRKQAIQLINGLYPIRGVDGGLDSGRRGARRRVGGRRNCGWYIK